jgi:hypothetical protein
MTRTTTPAAHSATSQAALFEVAESRIPQVHRAAARAAATLAAFTDSNAEPPADDLQIRVIGTPDMVSTFVALVATITGDQYNLTARRARTPGHVRAYLTPIGRDPS